MEDVPRNQIPVVGLEQLAQAVERLKEQGEADRALVGELHLALIGGWRPGRREPAYPDWRAWVDGWLAPRTSRAAKRLRWCNRYWEHPEVADRLEALWHTWEAAWPEETARATWFRDGLDHHLAIIGSDLGPLRDCSAIEGEHRVPAPLAQRDR